VIIMPANAPVFEVPAPLRPTTDDSQRLATRFVEMQVTLEAATSRVAIHAPSDGLGRAEARFGKQNWAAKHYWGEGQDQEQITVFEFDEALPAGPVTLRIPVRTTE
jgi:hypothetical protein